MMQRNLKKMLTSKPVFQASIGAFLFVIIAVWIGGLFFHRTMFENALISTNILSIATACFFTITLYNGLKLRDTLGKPIEKFKWEGWPESLSTNFEGGYFFTEGAGCESFFEVILTILITIVVAVVFYFLMLLFGNLLWAVGLAITSILYWVFFRAVRLVLKHAKTCKGNLWMSVFFGSGYTALYSGIFYSFLFICHFLL